VLAAVQRAGGRAEPRSVLALQLWSAGEEVGALDVFSRLPDAFDASSEQVALLFATHAPLLLGSIVRTGQLEQAVATRDVIGMAEGMVMQRHQVDETTAFSVPVALQLRRRHQAARRRRVGRRGRRHAAPLSTPDHTPDDTRRHVLRHTPGSPSPWPKANSGSS